ncbi:hypothetical protein SAMN02745163_02854 [Clostridium cavendishii DSM 21758]|uniref:Uncharacterized protein n=1 Tax=Clostridium cavendishii DSM 21758 TaxID=1121302 RepID=A0A1M6NBX3_9CLOT|nr:hypothetical protein [Clostridium cavendishii]SHJ93036.1 hypothetical protein SAMN02745163_02854 [Clostridium cavendishii DSM 21758]
MGRSNSINNLANQNQEFNNYMSQCTTNLKNRTKSETDEFLSKVDEFYSCNKWDKKPLGDGEHYDYCQKSEFSLDGVTETIKGIAKAVFGGDSSPKGTTIQKTEEVAKAILSIADFQLLALNAATAFITNIMDAFRNSASANYQYTISSQSLAPGLTLHVLCLNDSFQRKDFFNNEFIIENVFSFKLIYSFGKAMVEENMEYFQKHAQLIAKLESSQDTLQDKYNEALVDPTTSQETLDLLQKRLDMTTSMINKYRDEMEKIKDSYEIKLNSIKNN